MPGRLRCRKRKNDSQSAGSAKACPSHSRGVCSVDSKACGSRSGISCECEQWSAHRRCSASPQPQPRDDKENQQEALSCGESMDCEEDYSKTTVFPDDDSNHVLPVEHFFGNMDTLQDFPQRTPAPSTSVQRAQRRRRYYAPEDSEDSEDDQDRMSPCTQGRPAEENCPAQRH